MYFSVNSKNSAENCRFSATDICNEKAQFCIVYNHGRNILDIFTILSKIRLSIEVLSLIFQFTNTIVKIFAFSRQLGIPRIPEVSTPKMF